MDYFPANKFKRKPKTDEASLQSKCYRWFKNTYPEQIGRLWMQYNNPRSMQTGVFLKAQGMVSGVSDLAFLRSDGRMVFIELKTEKGRQSEEQKWWQSVVEANQARYYVVRTLEEFQVIITNNIKN